MTSIDCSPPPSGTGSSALSSAHLAAYLDRIGFADRPACDLVTLQAIVRAHVERIAFENIDVQLGRAMTTDLGAAFAKLVENKRGGWCYEHNGLLGAALAAIGFDVMRMSAGVMREVRSDQAMGSHLCLLVPCEGRHWLVDAGFGSHLAAPVPLQEGSWHQAPLPVSLGRTADGMWRLQVALGDRAMSYDFLAEQADEGRLATMCKWQASDPASVFVQNLSAQRRSGESYFMLRGKVLTIVSASGEEQREIGSARALVECLRDEFLLDVPDAADLWPAITARHAALFGDQAAPTT
ncbi:arylamine N-acetyltransferase [Novosphingobium sp. B1]|uniref:arylamine N-acetyltransferase family protein n=1 Tax=Novosphingobium sp. B1 TaxID=1938756 RepID=UPI0009D90BB0|nr:arylamine N-acetyltransferase [Novosphingobium sp. B1]SMC67946.1 N-hydroxyarylamine O-acetyltransferase [Novosphingobium sp. B1]